MGREIVKQLSVYNKVNLDTTKVDGYWAKFYDNFKGPEDIYLMNGHTNILPEIAKKHPKIIALTILETSLPDDWVSALNMPEIKQIWTISDFCKDLIIESGVKKPVFSIPLGVDKRFFKHEIDIFPKDQSFKFLNVSAPHCLGKKDRKGLDILIRAFKESFGDNPNMTLLLKINTLYADLYNKRLGRKFDMTEYLKNLLPDGTTTGNISILPEYMPIELLNNLYNSVDCGVFPARSEGFNLPAAEMMKIGKPVITTSYSGHSEFSDPRLQTKVTGLYPLDYSIYPYSDSLFAEPDIDHLKKLMNQVYRGYEKEKDLAEEHAKTMSKYTWENTGKELNNLLKKL